MWRMSQRHSSLHLMAGIEVAEYSALRVPTRNQRITPFHLPWVLAFEARVP